MSGKEKVTSKDGQSDGGARVTLFVIEGLMEDAFLAIRDVN